MSQLYVLGFAFTPDDKVALIKKKRPAWQAGKLNGIGGKVEGHESSSMAMVREFKEETGVDTPEKSWQFRGRMFGPDWSVFVYTCTLHVIKNVRTMEDESVALYDLDYPNDRDWPEPEWVMDAIENVPALIKLCRIPAEQPSLVFPRFELNYGWHLG